MSPETKAIVVSSLECELSSANDNLNRASCAFGSFSPEQMKADHGASGLTRQELLDGYKVRRDKVYDALMEARKL